MIKELKVVISCRVEPDLKMELEQEATNESFTLSNYIENILCERSLILYANKLLEEQKIQQSRLSVLIDENHRLREELQQLHNDNAVLNNQLEKCQEKRYWLDNSDIKCVVSAVHNLKQRYSKLTNKEILEVSLSTAIQNEDSFFTLYKMKDFLAKNPNFLTNKQL